MCCSTPPENQKRKHKKPSKSKQKAFSRWVVHWGWLACVLLWVGCASESPSSNIVRQTGRSLPGASAIAAPSSSSRPAAEEADIYRTRGHLLLYLHKYKGLTIFDLKDPKQPKQLSYLPLFGQPVEMFVTDKIAYVLVTKPIVASRDRSTMPYRTKQAAARLLTIDIETPSSPKILGKLTIQGGLRRGQARKAGHRIYVLNHYDGNANIKLDLAGVPSKATTVKGSTSLTSIDVTDPTQPKLLSTRSIHQKNTALLDKHWKEQSDLRFKELHTDGYHGAVMTAVPGYLIVTERWSVRAQFETHRQEITEFTGGRGCGGGTRENWTETRQIPIPFSMKLYISVVNVIDITKDDGNTTPKTRFAVAGVLGDQFKQSIGNHHFFGIVRRSVLVVQPDKITTDIKNVIVSVALQSNQPKILSSLPFGKPKETVRGSLFDHTRKVAYAITATGLEPNAAPQNNDVHRPGTTRREILRSFDPLYAIDISNPKKLNSLSDIDGLNGDVNLFQPIENGQYLVAVGRDTSPSCSGFDQGTGFSRTAISIIDVRDLKAIKLVQRRCVQLKLDGIAPNVTSSEVNWDRDQAHKLIGFWNDQTHRMIAVPVSYQLRGKQQIAVGLMRWDLEKYDETKKPEDQQVLEDLGTVAYRASSIERTILMKLPHAGGPALSLVNLSDELLSITSLQQPTSPQHLASLPLRQFVDAIYQFGDTLVEILLDNPYDGTQTYFGSQSVKRTMRTRKLNLKAPYSEPVLHEFALGEVSQLLKWGEFLIIFRTHNTLQHTRVDIWHLADPTKPQQVHQLTLPFIFTPKVQTHVNGKSRSVSHQWFMSRYGLVFHRQEQREKTLWETKLSILDLTDPTTPVLRELGNYRHKGTWAISRLHAVDDEHFILSLDNQSQDYRVIHWKRQTDGQWKEAAARRFLGALLHVVKYNEALLYFVGLGISIRDYQQLAMLHTENIKAPFTIVDTLAWTSSSQHDIIFHRDDNNEHNQFTLRTNEGILRYQYDEKGMTHLETQSGSTLGLTILQRVPGGLVMELQKGGLTLLPDGQGLIERELSRFIPLYHERMSSQGAELNFLKLRHFLQVEQKLWIAAGHFGILSFDLPEVPKTP